MVDYQIFCKIKRLHNEEKLSSRQISKIIGIDRKTISKWIKRDNFIKNTKAKRDSILDPYKGRIAHFLNSYNYSSEQIFNMLKEEGYKGSYSLLSHYVLETRPRKKEAYFTLSFEKGETAQVDFASYSHIALAHSKRRLYAFIMTLCYSKMMYVEFIFSQSQEYFLQCHRNAFEYFGGVPQKIMVDNCKVAVLEHSKCQNTQNYFKKAH